MTSSSVAQTAMAPSLAALILHDFSQHHWPVSSLAVSSVESTQASLYLLLALDQLLSHLVMGPLVVAFWRGIWIHSRAYLDTEVCGGDILLANAMAVVAGIIGCTVVHVFQYEVRRAAGQPGTFRYILTARAFSVWWGFFFVYLWRGMWDGISAYFLGGYTTLSIKVSSTCLAIGFSSLCLTGLSHSGVGCPIGIGPDLTPSHFQATTLLSSGPSNKWAWRVFDGLLSNLVQVMAVLAWYGTWTTQDILLEEWLEIPHLNSALISVIGGFLLSFLLLILQIPLLHLRHLLLASPQSVPLLLATQMSTTFVSLLSLVSGYTSFRGVWYLWDIIYLPNDPEASAVTGAILGAGGLMVVGATACLHGGVYWDGVRSNPVTTPYYYLSYYYVQTVQQNNCINPDKKERVNGHFYKEDGLSLEETNFEKAALSQGIADVVC